MVFLVRSLVFFSDMQRCVAFGIDVQAEIRERIRIKFSSYVRLLMKANWFLVLHFSRCLSIPSVRNSLCIGACGRVHQPFLLCPFHKIVFLTPSVVETLLHERSFWTLSRRYWSYHRIEYHCLLWSMISLDLLCCPIIFIMHASYSIAFRFNRGDMGKKSFQIETSPSMLLHGRHVIQWVERQKWSNIPKVYCPATIVSLRNLCHSCVFALCHKYSNTFYLYIRSKIHSIAVKKWLIPSCKVYRQVLWCKSE